MDKTTGIIFFPAFDWAISPTHPEREERLLYTRDQLFEEGILDWPGIVELRPQLAGYDDIARTQFCIGGVPAQTTEAHLIAAGAGLTLADQLKAGAIRQGFALIRPPGHHGMRVVHGNRGFCNTNNMAILTDYLRTKHRQQRIAIIDTDAHHGDGTQDIFYHDADVLYISMHQDGRTLYPGSGFTNEWGGPQATGYTINLPLPPGSGDEALLWLTENVVLPILQEFKPDLILNSAGQDNHFSDPLASMQVSAIGYGKLTELLAPDIILLEGGYGVETCLPYVNLAILAAQAGIDYTGIVEPDKHRYRLQEPKGQQDYLQKLQAQTFAHWQQRGKLGSAYHYQDGVYTYHKEVYYDTSGIRERQQETLYPCTNCTGILTIASKAKGYGYPNVSAFCIVVPVNACASCEMKAEALLQKYQNSYDYSYLQNKKR